VMEIGTMNRECCRSDETKVRRKLGSISTRMESSIYSLSGEPLRERIIYRVGQYSTIFRSLLKGFDTIDFCGILVQIL
jgi:hypothetical protein